MNLGPEALSALGGGIPQFKEYLPTMPAAPIPSDESERLQILKHFELLDSPNEERFDRITDSARQLLDAPVAVISLIDKERQWFKSCTGLDVPETPRAYSFCAYALTEKQPIVINNALEDDRVKDNPLVLEEPFIRAYLGIPIELRGVIIGTLCCIWFETREIGARDLDTLKALATWAERELVLREKSVLVDELERNRQKAEMLFQQVPDILLQIDSEGQVEKLNQQAAEFWRYHLGYVPNLLTDQNLAEWSVSSFLESAKKLGVTETDPLVLQNKAGQKAFVQLKVSAVELHDEASFLVGIKNVSEQVFLSTTVTKLQQEVMEQQLALEQTIQERDEFLARLGHEIRNPVNGILGMVRLMKGDGRYADENLQAVTSCVDALVSLVDDTLDITRINQGRMSTEARPFHLPHLVRMVSHVSEQALASKDIQLRVRISTSHDTFLGDSEKLRQILANLISNAFKYTDSGRIDVSASQSGELVRFEVRDSGHGISPELRETIFEPYTQAKAKDGDSKRGVGLGLAIVKRLVTLLGGEIGVESQLSEGSMFYFELPMAPCDAEELPTGAVLPNEPALGLSVLVVDDNTINRKVMTIQLEGIGCVVHAAENGQVCLDYLLRHEVDLILMDCGMPVLDGYKTTEMIRREPEKYGNPLIMALTGAGDSQARERCLASGMNDFVNKPIRLEALQEKIQILMRDVRFAAAH